MACIHPPAWKPVCGTNVYFRGKLTCKWLKDASCLHGQRQKPKCKGRTLMNSLKSPVPLYQMFALQSSEQNQTGKIIDLLHCQIFCGLQKLEDWTMRPVWYVRGLEGIVSSQEAATALLDLSSLLRCQTTSFLELRKDEWSDPTASKFIH